MGFLFSEQAGKKKGSSSARSKLPSNISVKLLNERSCQVCPLDKAPLRHPKMAATGSPHPDVYVIGEAPGKEEDKRGKQFVGEAGRYLRPRLPEYWHVRFNNIIQCRPPNNRDPEMVEMECCRLRIVRDIEKTKPTVVMGVGNVPLRWMLNHDQGITAWRGRFVPVKIGKHKCWFFPTFHPSYLNRMLRTSKRGHPLESDEGKAFLFDIKRLDQFLDDPPEPRIEEAGFTDNIDWVLGGGQRDLNRMLLWMKRLKKLPQHAVDIETYPLRPYAKGARMLTVAVGTYEQTYAWPLDHPEAWGRRLRKRVLDEFGNFLVESKLKICHNLSMEQEWFACYYGDDILRKTRWADTWAQSYVLDERKGMHNLDVLCLQYFGFQLKSLFDLNMQDLRSERLENVLPYNACDTKYTELLYRCQERELKRRGNKKLLPVYESHIFRNPSIVLMQKAGMRVDFAEVRKLQEKLGDQIADLEKRMRRLPEAKEAQSILRTVYDPSKDKHNLVLYRDVLKRSEIFVKDDKKSKTGVSVKEDVLRKIPSDVSEHMAMLIEYRSLRTVKNTFLDSMQDLVYPDGLLHPNVNDKFTSTSRLSMDNPNGQNFPKHKHVYVRRIIIAPPGYWMVCADYGAIEYRVIAMASQDKRVCDALWKGQDIHREWAQIIIDELGRRVMDKAVMGYFGYTSRDQLKTNKDDYLKEARQTTKNQWVFPRFFGASDKSCANYMRMSEQHSAKIGRMFWDDFSGVKRWQEKTIEKYNRRGYVELLTGRRRRAPVGYNEIINTPIQGTAAEIVLDAEARTSEAGYQAMLNVHDDLDFMIEDSRLESDVYEIARIMSQCPFGFVTVPLLIEVTAGPNWHEQEKLGDFLSTEFAAHAVVRSASARRSRGRSAALSRKRSAS